jgi:hypothetical protein
MTSAPRAASRATLATVVLAWSIAACGAPSGNVSSPGPGGDAASATKALVVRALGGVGLQAVESIKPYRPAETASLIGAPRSVIQVQLPDDPDHGYVVIYSLGSAVTAEKAAFDQAAYVASPAGAVQFPPGSHFVLRMVDTTVIFFTWSPGGSPDQRTHLIEGALNTIGIAVPVTGS